MSGTHNTKLAVALAVLIPQPANPNGWTTGDGTIIDPTGQSGWFAQNYTLVFLCE